METYTTKVCIMCQKTGTMKLHMDDVIAWHRGRLAHLAFPYLKAEEREQVISGTHPRCWRAMFTIGEE